MIPRGDRIPALAAAALLLSAVVVVCRAGEPGPAAQAAEPAIASDTLAASLLATVRGADPVVCELAVRAVDGRHGWSSTVDELVGVGAPLSPLQRATVRWAIHDRNTGPGDRDPAAIDPLAAGLRDADPCVRRMAALKLGRMRQPRAVSALLAALAAPDPGLRAAGALGLGYAEDAATIGELGAALGDASPQVRATAAWALGAIEDERAIPQLLPVLARDEDADVRMAAAWALGEIE